MAAIQNARERARAELTLEIKKEARRQMATEGVHTLSLRAVARQLGMASSAIYRYYPSRDDLLTALIIDAYDAVGEAAESAAKAALKADPPNPRAHWMVLWHAIRAWAKKNPHEYALIYGSPVPGYQAPQSTVAPAARVPVALLEPVKQCATHFGLVNPLRSPPVTDLLLAQATGIADALAPALPHPVVLRTVMAYTLLFGTISFELFGQYVGSVDPTDDYFVYTADQMADLIGLMPPS